MKITATILLFSLMILVGGEERARAALYNEVQHEQLTRNQVGAVDISIKANETFAAQKKLANEMKKEIDKAALTKALELLNPHDGKYPTAEQVIQALSEKPTIDHIPGKGRQEGYHDIDYDILNSVADNKDVDGEPEPVITIKQGSMEPSATIGKETGATSMSELIKTEILIFAVIFAAIQAVIFDKQLLVILKLIFGKIRQIAKNKPTLSDHKRGKTNRDCSLVL